MEPYRRKFKPRLRLGFLAAFVIFAAGLLIGLVSGHGAGFNDALAEEPVICERARDEEYRRVVASIARTMRCSTEEEFAAGQDHECDPSEVELDAGLVNEKGEIIR